MSAQSLPKTCAEMHAFAAKNGIDQVKRILREWARNGQGDELTPTISAPRRPAELESTKVPRGAAPLELIVRRRGQNEPNASPEC
jgi:hypothetical protein